MKFVIDDILDKLPEENNMVDIMTETTKRSPYISVCFQECERMNFLLAEIRRSLNELDLCLKVPPVVIYANIFFKKKTTLGALMRLSLSTGGTHHLLQYRESAGSPVH